MRRPLVVEADDFGLTEGVSYGILRAHRDGVVTATAVLAVGPALPRMAAALGASGVDPGLHVALVGEDPPVLTAAEVPTLVDGRGRFPRSWRTLVARSAAGRVDPADVTREATAQLAVVRGHGIVPTHLDTHQNVHLWPSLAAPLLALAGAEGLLVARVPRSRRRTATNVGVGLLATRLDRRLQRRGRLARSAFAGLDEAGGWDADRLVGAIHRLGADGTGPALLVAHPGEATDPDRRRYRWGYRWPDELAGLVDPTVRTAVDRAGFRLATHAEAAGVPPPAPEPDPLAPYRSMPLRARAHVRGRWASAPLAEVARLVPRGGRVLDLGCGHGVLALHLARTDPGRTVHAVDVDPAKVAVATAAVARAGHAGRVQVEVVDPDWLPPPDAYDAVVVADVLHLLGRERAAATVDAAVAALRPGGRLVAKEMADRPRWKATVNQLQERVAVGTGITAGATIAVLTADEVAARARAAGAEAWTIALDAGYAHPHAAAVVERR